MKSKMMHIHAASLIVRFDKVILPLESGISGSDGLVVPKITSFRVLDP
jgi:hypothetical protein